MAHCAHVLAPTCAWAESTEPKKRSRSIASRLGNAIRAMKPVARRSEEEKVYMLNAAALSAVDCSLGKQTLSDDEISTQSGGSRRSSVSSLQSERSSPSPTESVEEMLPGIPAEDILPACSQPGKSRTSELQALASLIAFHAQFKFSGRVYQDVRNAFLAVDANGDGKLTPTEALAFCKHFDLSPKTTASFLGLLDSDDTGLADWSSFLAAYAPVFQKKTDFRLNAGMGRKWPAIQ